MANKVFIATSLDGYIATKDGKIDWLPSPSSVNADMGYEKFMESIDALVMGRNTYEMVLSFGIDWPYSKKVFVVSSSLKSITENLKDKVELLNSKNPKEIVKLLKSKGYHDLYIDGGITIQGFLKEDLIDEMIITTIPVLLGGGKSLFGKLQSSIKFKAIDTKLLDTLIQTYYKRDING